MLLDLVLRSYPQYIGFTAVDYHCSMTAEKTAVKYLHVYNVFQLLRDIHCNVVQVNDNALYGKRSFSYMRISIHVNQLKALPVHVSIL